MMASTRTSNMPNHRNGNLLCCVNVRLKKLENYKKLTVMIIFIFYCDVYISNPCGQTAQFCLPSWYDANSSFSLLYLGNLKKTIY